MSKPTLPPPTNAELIWALCNALSLVRERDLAANTGLPAADVEHPIKIWRAARERWDPAERAPLLPLR